MSKKFEAIKKAIFYSEQKPEKLAALLEPLIADKASAINISGAASIEVPSADSTTSDYAAKLVSQFGDEMSGEVTLAIDGTVTGVSISSNTVTVASTATAKSFTLKATSGELTATFQVALTKAE